MPAHPYPELKQKLSLLKVEQRKVQYRYLWRSLFVSGLAGGLLTIAMSPRWQITNPNQIIIKSDRFIDDSAIYKTLAITQSSSFINNNVTNLPFQGKSPWLIPSQQIDRYLESIPALKSVQVTKTIFPPSVKIYIQERIPVATAISSGEIGFLDYQGVWLDPNLYNQNHKNLPLTQIKVVNFKNEYSKIWQEIYNLISAYPTIKVKEVKWEEGGNLVIITNQIKVILGTNTSLLKRQFAALASFSDLADNPDLETFSQIDLTNPDIPFLDQYIRN